MFSRNSSFLTDVSRQGERFLLRISGELDIATVPELRPVIRQVVAARPSRLTIDLAELAFVDLFGLRALLEAKQQAMDVHAEFHLHHVGDWTRRVIQLTRFPELASSVETGACSDR